MSQETLEANRLIVRPAEALVSPFQFGEFVRPGNTKVQQRQAFKPRDFSGIGELVNKQPSVLPNFGNAETQPPVHLDASEIKAASSMAGPVSSENAMAVTALAPVIQSRISALDLKIPMDDFPIDGVSNNNVVLNGDDILQSCPPLPLKDSSHHLSTYTDLHQIFTVKDDTCCTLKGPPTGKTETIHAAAQEEKRSSSRQPSRDQCVPLCSNAGSVRTPVISTPSLILPKNKSAPSTTNSRAMHKSVQDTSTPGRADERHQATGVESHAMSAQNRSRVVRRPRLLVKETAVANQNKRSGEQDLPEFILLREMQTLRNHMQERDEEIGHLKEELSASNLKTELQEKTIIELRDLLRDSGIEARTIKEQKDKHQSALELLRRRTEASSAALQALHDNDLILRESMRQYGSTIGELTCGIADVRAEVALALNSIQAKRDESASTMAVLREIQLAHGEELLRSRSLQAFCDRNAGLMSEDRDRVVDLSRQLSESLALQTNLQKDHEAELASRERQLADKEKHIEDLKRQIHDSDSTGMTRLLADVTALRELFLADKERLLQELHDLNAIANRNERELQKAVCEVQELKKAEAAQAVEQARGQAEFRSVKDELLAAENQVYGYIDELAKVRHEIAQLKESHSKEIVSFMEREALSTEQQEGRQIEVQRLQAEALKKDALLAELRSSVDLHASEMQNCHELGAKRLAELRTSLVDQAAADMRSLEERLHQIKLQEHMSFENQIKAQSSKILRLEAELKSIQAVQQTTIASASTQVADSQTVIAPVADVQETTANLGPGEPQVVSNVMSTDFISATQCLQVETHATPDESITSLYFANINESSQSCEVDDPTDLDFINDTPPRVSCTIARPKKSIGQEKRRRSIQQLEVVRHPQDESSEISALTLVTPARVKTGRARSSNKKRKNN